MDRLTMASMTLAIVAVTQPSPSWRSAPTPELMLPSSTDCWEPAIAIGPRDLVYIVAGQRSGGAASEAFDPGNGRHFWPEALTFGPDGALWFAVPSMADADIAKRLQTDVQLHVYRSTDDGRSWQDARISSSPRFLKGCAHDPECRVKLPGISVAISDDGRAHAAPITNLSRASRASMVTMAARRCRRTAVCSPSGRKAIARIVLGTCGSTASRSHSVGRAERPGLSESFRPVRHTHHP